ncbi:cellulose biosynthesis protein BcsQ [Paraburkholderia phymatum]|uniref:Cellulose biosynthesis protein BcsQ n=1 Tax=Paraburkholderia phymatum TaxID=148447 RepID=A0ACC6TXB8_9BURK
MKTIAVVSTAGGAGRTTLSAALAVLLARRGRQIVALDFDPQNLLGAYLGLDSVDGPGIGDAITVEAADGVDPWQEWTWRNEEGVLFVPYGRRPLAENTRCETRLAQAPQWLARSLALLDLDDDAAVLIDTPRYPSQQADQAIRAADLVLCVTPPEPVACATLVSSLPDLQAASARFSVVVNRLNPARDMQRDVLTMLRAALGPGLLVDQRVHFDAALPESFARGSWLFDDAPYSQTAHDLQGLANWLDASLGERADKGKNR